VTRFFDGLDQTGGVVPLSQWWESGEADAAAPGGLAAYCGIGKKA
jgi:hypothetical protein